MKIQTRRTIYITFFAIFFIIVPILILYAAGYSYNFKKNRIEKTGVLIVETFPKKSNVYLNDKILKKTPARFSHLLPDIYKVTINKTGYYSWENEISIRSGQSSFATNIILFKKSEPILIKSGKISILAGSPDQQKIIYSQIINESQEEVRLINNNGATDLLISKFNPKTFDSLEFVGWSPDGKKALIKQIIDNFNSYFIIDTSTLEIQN